jgi:protocatechuate 3,4-dioxygenase beta subunit
MRNWTRWLIAVAVFLGAIASVLYWNVKPRAPGRDRWEGATQALFNAVGGRGAGSAAPPPGSSAPAPRDARDAGSSTIERLEVLEDAASPRGALEGRVLSRATGLGIAGAELTFAQGTTAASTASGADGKFTFAPPQAGTWRLAAAAAQGYLPFAPEWGHSPIVVESVPGRRIRGVQVYLTEAIDYLGLVLSPAGAAVGGAKIQLLGASTGEHVLLPLQERFVADEKGLFHFHATDDSVLEARHPDFAPGRATVNFSARVSHRLTIKLGARKGGAPEAMSITGRVLDPKGSPVAGAVIVAQAEDTSLASGEEEAPSGQATSDAAGNFRVEPLDPGPYTVVARQEGFAPAERAHVPAGIRDLVLALTESARLEGSVRDTDGRPIPAFTINLWRRKGPLGLELVHSGARFDPAGRFEISGLPAGEVRVTATAPGFAESKVVELVLQAAPAPAANVDFTLSAGARLTGRVLERGTKRPLSGALVTVEGWPGAAAAGSASPNRLNAVTDAAGRFQIPGVRAGKASLLVSAQGHHARVVPTLSVPETGDADPVTVELTAVEAGEDPRVELAGVGVVLQAEGEGLVVRRTLPLGGGAAAGIAAGDTILAIDGKPAVQLGHEGAINAIRGPEGTDVSLKVRKADGQVVDVVARRKIVRN